jgi:mercuric ion transport protein
LSAEKNENAAIVGVGVAACAVCCAGPILGVLAAIGLGTAAGFALFGTVAIVIGAMLIAFVVLRRRRRAAACAVPETPQLVPVELTDMRSVHR